MLTGDGSDFNGHVIAAIRQLSRYSARHSEAWPDIDLSMIQFRALCRFRRVIMTLFLRRMLHRVPFE